jgi:hypothetical protein
VTHYNLEKLAADMGVSEGVTKEAAWRDLPHLARGVLANMQEHTLPDVRRVVAVRDALRDPEYLSMSLPLRERAKRIAHVYAGTPMGDARENEVLARLIRMRQAAGKDKSLLDILQGRYATLQSAERRARADRAYQHAPSIGTAMLDMDTASLRRNAGQLDESSYRLGRAALDRVDDLRRASPIDADFLQRAGAKPVPQVIGTKLGLPGVVDEPHYFRDGVKHTLVGTPGSKIPEHLAPGFGTNLGPVGMALAGSQPVLAHELGHATGLGGLLTMPLYKAGVPALKLPEELRAQMRGQDIMRDWQRRGVASGLPAELAQLTPEQLKEHTIPLSTYADAGARHLVNTALDLRDKARSVQDRLRRIVGREGTE